jgi:hypothetical protein
MQPAISLHNPLHLSHEHDEIRDEDTIVRFGMGDATIEVRHMGEYLEVHFVHHNTYKRLMIEPRVSNEIWLRVQE